MALQFHPDKQHGKTGEASSSPAAPVVTIEELNEAKSVLLDADLRKVYDAYGGEGVAAAEMVGSPGRVNSVVLWILRKGGALQSQM